MRTDALLAGPRTEGVEARDELARVRDLRRSRAQVAADEAAEGLRVLTSGPIFRFKLQEGVRYLINPGSVGQPRDGSPLTSFAMYDSEKRLLSIHRLEYPVRSTQDKIVEAGLPRPLADRLALGR